MSTSVSATSPGSTRRWWRGADRHPGLTDLRSKLPGPFGKIYPVSAVGKAVLRGVEKRRRWVVVPGWARLLLLNRGWFWAVTEAASNRQVPELDARFAQDVAERGREVASGPWAPAARPSARGR